MKSEQSCAKCGETRGYVLDYHHIDPTQKDNTIARMTSNKYKIESILSEIEKINSELIVTSIGKKPNDD